MTVLIMRICSNCLILHDAYTVMTRIIIMLLDVLRTAKVAVHALKARRNAVVLIGGLERVLLSVARRTKRLVTMKITCPRNASPLPKVVVHALKARRNVEPTRDTQVIASLPISVVPMMKNYVIPIIGNQRAVLQFQLEDVHVPENK